MKDKIARARNMFASKANFPDNPELVRIIRKCCNSYLLQCVILRKDEFTLSYNGKHILPFKRRFQSYFSYLKGLMHLGPKFSKPVYVKVTNAPNEYYLDMFLRHHCMQIIDEKLGLVKTQYVISVK